MPWSSPALTGIAAADPRARSPYLRRAEIKRTLLVVIAGDRGLAGGYNSNVLKQAEAQQGPVTVLPIGKRSQEYFAHHGADLFTEEVLLAADVSVGECFALSRKITEGYLKGDYDAVKLCYTRFDRRDVMEQLGVKENSKEWQRLAIQIENTEAILERYETQKAKMENELAELVGRDGDDAHGIDDVVGRDDLAAPVPVLDVHAVFVDCLDIAVVQDAHAVFLEQRHEHAARDVNHAAGKPVGLDAIDERDLAALHG